MSQVTSFGGTITPVGMPIGFEELLRDDTLLVQAARTGDSVLCKSYLDHKTNPNCSEPEYNSTALHECANNGDYDLCQLFLRKGAEPDAIRKDGTTPLHLAAQKGFKAICELLLHFGAPPDMATHRDGGNNALSQVLFTNRATNNMTLEGINEMHAHRWGWNTALHYAALNADVETVKLLLAHGANPNLGDSLGNTPLHIAADASRGDRRGLDDYRFAAVCEQLLHAGACTSARNNDGMTAAQLAMLAPGKDLASAKLLMAWRNARNSDHSKGAMLPPTVPIGI